MRALILQHTVDEGAGILEPCLGQRGWQLEVVPLYEGAAVPADPSLYQAIIVMGGPMGVEEEAVYPFLRAEHTFLQQAMAYEVPVLGICLGAQLVAKALGARVYRNPHPEIGWYTIDLTPAGEADPLFTGLPSPLRVFQWHYDAFEVPVGTALLASSPLCPHQAFRYRDRVYGLLFHLELTSEMIHTWVTTAQGELAAQQGPGAPARMLADTACHFASYHRVGMQVMANLIDRVWVPLASSPAE